MRKLHISDNEINIQMRQIFNPVLQGESATALCYPCCKIAYNLSSFLKQPILLKKYLGPHYKKYEFITISLEKNESVESFLQKINQKKSQFSLIEICRNIIKNGKDPYFFILQADYPPPQVMDQILTLLHSVILQSEKVGVMIFFETNAFNSIYVEKILQENTKFLQNILYFPLYSRPERDIFLQNLILDWNIHPTKKLLRDISNSFGGSLWLLREAVRCFKDYGFTHINDIYSSPGIQLRIQTILNQLTSEEKEYLAQIHINQNENIPQSMQHYFLQIGLIEKYHKKGSITIPALLPYLETICTSQLLEVSKKCIMFKNKDISLFFTPQEKIVLTVLLNRKGSLVSREIIAKALWRGDWEDRYSDWAIDKLISRLKTTLYNLDIPKNIIQVKKGRGIQI